MQTKDQLETKPKQFSDKPEFIKDTKNGKAFSLKAKIIIIISIGIIICLTVSVVALIITQIKTKKEHKMEISDLELEKSVLENQKRKLNETI